MGTEHPPWGGLLERREDVTMPRSCTICTHRDRAAIEQAMQVAVPLRRIEAQYGVTRQSALRHQRHGEPNHVADHPSAHAQPCPCHRIDWRGLALDAHRVQEYLGTVQDPAQALPLLKYVLGILARLLESAALVQAPRANDNEQ